jgi:hypothetical protein
VPVKLIVAPPLILIVPVAFTTKCARKPPEGGAGALVATATARLPFSFGDASVPLNEVDPVGGVPVPVVFEELPLPHDPSASRAESAAMPSGMLREAAGRIGYAITWGSFRGD